MRSDLGWRRLAKCSTGYHIDDDFKSQKSYISDAAALFHQAEIRFPDYQIVFVVAPEAASFPASPAFTPGVNDETPCPGGTIRHAVTFGTDSYANRYVTWCTRSAICSGCPICIRAAAEPTTRQSAAGRSCATSSIPSASWLAPAQERMAAGIQGDLHQRRYAGVVRHPEPAVRLPADCPWSCFRPTTFTTPPRSSSSSWPSRCSEPTASTGARACSSIPSTRRSTHWNRRWSSSPGKSATAPDYGYLYEAPYGVGDVARARGPASVALAVTVLQKFGSCYNIKIEYRP